MESDGLAFAPKSDKKVDLFEGIGEAIAEDPNNTMAQNGDVVLTDLQFDIDNQIQKEAEADLLLPANFDDELPQERTN